MTDGVMPDFDPYLSWLGIPPTQRPPTHYQLLGVDPAITDAAVIKALALQRIGYVRNFQRGEHADLCARLLEELAHAEATLTDRVKRSAYDKTLRPVAPPPRAEPTPVVAKSIPARPPAPLPPVDEAPPKRRRRSRRNNVNAVKWIVGSVAALVVVIGLVLLPSLLRGPSDGAAADSAKPKADTAPVAAPVAPVAPKSFVATYRLTPADVEAVVARGDGKLERSGAEFSLSYTESAAAAGLELTFSKKGFTAKTVRVEPKDVAAPVNLSLEPIPRATFTVDVVPRSAEISVGVGEATKGASGRWTVSVPGDVSNVSVAASAPGFVAQRIDALVRSPPKRILLKASATDWWKQYKALGPDHALRLVGRVGAFGYGARVFALSRNGKFLAVAERQWPAYVHVWDVENEKFVGPVMVNEEIRPAGTSGPYCPPVSIAVTNDGKTVALSCFVVSIFDVAAGKEVKKFGRDVTKFTARPKNSEPMRSAAFDPSSSDPGDTLSLCFSGDDAILYFTLRNGRVMARTVSDWKVVESFAGPGVGAEDVRFSADSAAATAHSWTGPRLWQRESGKTTVLQKWKDPLPAGRWSGKPDHDAFYDAPAELKGPPKNDPWDETPIPPQYPIEVRDYEAPDKTRKTLLEPHPVQALEALSPTHVAAVVYRHLGEGENADRHGDYGLRIWTVEDGQLAADAFLPTPLYAIRSSDDGRVIAVLGDREHVVYLWKFDPKGKPRPLFAAPTGWADYPRLEWKRVDKDGKVLCFQELGLGRWQHNDAVLVERLRTAYAVTFRDGVEELRLYNNGLFWKTRPGVAEAWNSHPNFEGYRRDGPLGVGKAAWEPSIQGAWSIGDLPARRPEHLTYERNHRDGD